MTTSLETLHGRLVRLDPELYVRLQDQRQLTAYLESFLDLPDPENALCEAVSPSAYDYLAGILEEEFLEPYLAFSRCGILCYELINLSAHCRSLLSELGFPENRDSLALRLAITGAIADYLEGGSSDGL